MGFRTTVERPRRETGTHAARGRFVGASRRSSLKVGRWPTTSTIRRIPYRPAYGRVGPTELTESGIRGGIRALATPGDLPTGFYTFPLVLAQDRDRGGRFSVPTRARAWNGSVATLRPPIRALPPPIRPPISTPCQWYWKGVEIGGRIGGGSARMGG